MSLSTRHMPVVASSKLSWVDETGGGAVTANPGRDAHDFKNLNWKGGAVPIRKELLTALARVWFSCRVCLGGFAWAGSRA